jgi:hypothetical protein
MMEMERITWPGLFEGISLQGPRYMRKNAKAVYSMLQHKYFTSSDQVI